MSSESYIYIGDELEIFAHAANWKRYWHSRIKPYLGNTVLEVGAGIGGTTTVLVTDNHFDRWLGIEPDETMLSGLEARQQAGDFPGYCAFRMATVSDLPTDECFDSAIYIDVLEHIEDHAEEVERVSKHINPGGHIIILSPAHQYLFTEFDEAIGHYRRYTRPMLADITPDGFEVRKSDYLDSVGMLLSLSNKLILHSPHPRLSQIELWDRLFVPVSRVVDPLFGYRLGKSILHVWQRAS